MENPELVEEYPRDFELTQFEKILVASKRAKDLHNFDKAPMVEIDRKAPYIALEELREDQIQTVYREEQPVKKIGEDGEETEEEE